MPRFLVFFFFFFLSAVSAQEEKPTIRPEVRALVKDRLNNYVLRNAVEDSTFGEVNRQVELLTNGDIKQLIRELKEESVSPCINWACKLPICEGLSLCMKLQVIRYAGKHIDSHCSDSFLEELASECELTEDLKHHLDEEHAVNKRDSMIGIAVLIMFMILIVVSEVRKEKKRDEEEAKKRTCSLTSKSEIKKKN